MADQNKKKKKVTETSNRKNVESSGKKQKKTYHTYWIDEHRNENHRLSDPIADVHVYVSRQRLNAGKGKLTNILEIDRKTDKKTTG